MLHKTRKYLVSEVPSLKEMAHKLYNYTWTLCSGFKFGGLTLINDSLSESNAQEYAVFRNGRQIESLTVSWYESEEKLFETLLDLSESGGVDDYLPFEFKVHTCDDYCRLCA